MAISTYHPQIILLMIGTNDVNLSIDLANAPGRLATLIDEIITDAPNSLLVVAQLTPTTTDTENTRFQAYNAAIPAIVQQRAAAGKHVMLVDMYSTFTANYKTALMNDNLHPNPTGYGLMGDTWYNAIVSFLR
jgi:lysophospholipase L1-like esterase